MTYNRREGGFGLKRTPCQYHRLKLEVFNADLVIYTYMCRNICEERYDGPAFDTVAANSNGSSPSAMGQQCRHSKIELSLERAMSGPSQPRYKVDRLKQRQASKEESGLIKAACGLPLRQQTEASAFSIFIPTDLLPAFAVKPICTFRSTPT